MNTLPPVPAIVKLADLEATIPPVVMVADDADLWSDDRADEMADDDAAFDEYMTGAFAY